MIQPKRCGACGRLLVLNKVFARPDSWVCVKAGCPAWRWEWIDEKYGYIRTRKDLCSAPHHWRIPTPVLVTVTLKPVKEESK